MFFYTVPWLIYLYLAEILKPVSGSLAIAGPLMISSTHSSRSGISLVAPLESGTFHNEAAELFNKLLLSVRNCSDFNTFSEATFNPI